MVQTSDELTIAAPAGARAPMWDGPRFAPKLIGWSAAVIVVLGLLLLGTAVMGAPALAAAFLVYFTIPVALFAISLRGWPHGVVHAEVAPGSVVFTPMQRFRSAFVLLAVVSLASLALSIPATAELGDGANRRWWTWVVVAAGAFGWGVWGSVRKIRQPRIRLTPEGVIRGEPHKSTLIWWTKIARARVEGPHIVLVLKDGSSVVWLCTLTNSDPMIVSSLMQMYVDRPGRRDEIGEATLRRVADGTWRS